MKSVIPCGVTEPLFSLGPPSWGIHLQREQAPSSWNGTLPRLLASSPSCCSNCHNCLRNSKITLPVLYSHSETMHLWGSLFSRGSVRNCVVAWRRAPFRLNIATHSLSSVTEQSQEDLFLPLTDSVPQPGLASVTLLIRGSKGVLTARNLPLFLVHIFQEACNVSLLSRLRDGIGRCPSLREPSSCLLKTRASLLRARFPFPFGRSEFLWVDHALSLSLWQGSLARRRLSSLSYFVSWGRWAPCPQRWSPWCG